MTIDNRLPESTLCPSLSLSFTILTDFTVGGSSIDAIIYAPGEGRQCAQEVLHLHLLAGHDQLLQSPVTGADDPSPQLSRHRHQESRGHHQQGHANLTQAGGETSQTFATICLLFRDDIRGVLVDSSLRQNHFLGMNQTNLVLYISASLWSSNCVEFIVMSYLQLSRSCRCLCNIFIYCSGQPPSCSTGPVFSLQIISSPLQHCSRTSHPGTTDTALHWASGHTDIKLHLQLGPDWGHE